MQCNYQEIRFVSIMAEEKKFKFKSLKEMQEDSKKAWDKFQEDSKKNWLKFVDAINEFFGTPPDKKITHSGPSMNQNVQSPASQISLTDKEPEFKDIAELRPIPEKKTPAEQWDENWKRFGESALLAFDDMRTKINGWNMKNAEWIQDQILKNEQNMNIWLKKQEQKSQDMKQKQQIALERFNKWVNDNNDRNKRFFEQQKKAWDDQIQKWKQEQEDLKAKNKEKWESSQNKFKEDYEHWIQERREKAMEKAKYKLRVGWRQSLYLTLTFLPIILLIVVIVALINALTK